jgi:3-hydroxyacyl-[acyl-carrier-protein] dehydratase
MPLTMTSIPHPSIATAPLWPDIKAIRHMAPTDPSPTSPSAAPSDQLNNSALISESTHIAVDLHIPDTLDHFTGHFPQYPVLPGVVQIDWAIGIAHRYFLFSTSFKALENIKFQALILPNTDITLGLRWDKNKAALHFSYSKNQRTYSSGRIIFSSGS